MAGLSISGESLDSYCPFYKDGGLMTSAFIKDGHITSGKVKDGNITSGKLANDAVTSAKIKDDAVTTTKVKNANVTVAKLHCEVLTGTVSAGTAASAAHTLGVVPTLVIPTCRTSGGGVATTGAHTSAGIFGIVTDTADTTFIIYVFE